MWFSHHGISVVASKRALGFGGTIIGEFIPLLNALPLWTAFVVITALKNRVKESL